MLRSSILAASPEIQQLIDDILNEETRFILSERRDATRKSITRAIKIKPCNQPGREYSAITRDISNQGVGLVGQIEWPRDTMAKILIDRFGGDPSTVVASCRWCDMFADGWYVSGWNFVRVETA